MPEPTAPTFPLERVRDAGADIVDAVATVVDGKTEAIRTALTVMLAEGHLLVEDVPGVGKTVLAKALGASVGGTVNRIQFTSDMLPSDVTGVNVFDQSSGTFRFSPGPVFANVVIGDEINRTSPKTQSALLEAMAESQVTVDGVTRQLDSPFMIVATQNPIDMEGTYPLPEAQVDRFMMKVIVDYPSNAEEHAIVARALRPPEPPQPMLTPGDLMAMRERARQVYVDPSIIDYAVRLVSATRSPATAGLGELERYVTHGASPRASIALVTGARALAFLRGRDYVLPHDLAELALDVLRHRLVLSYEALADDVDPDTIVTRVLGAVRAPDVVLQNR